MSTRRTSALAADSIIASAGTLRAAVLDYLRAHGPSTDEEMQLGLAMNPSTQRPRRVELWRAGAVCGVGTRKTRSGREAVTWGVVVPRQINAEGQVLLFSNATQGR